MIVETFPMHGAEKLLKQGFRTRDGHMIEWFARDTRVESVNVYSRPEPAVLSARPRGRQISVQGGCSLAAVTSRSFALPRLGDRQHWWVASNKSYSASGSLRDSRNPAVVWNPFIATSNISDAVFANNRTTVLDLLDDWTVHYAFQQISAQVELAYRESFARATHVVANSEGTLALAHRFGRDDAELVLNGVDPERFSTKCTAKGPLTVGYVGKIGKRLDLDLVLNTADMFPNVLFRFAGPVLDREFRAPLRSRTNIEMLGDVHYRDMPKFLETVDIGWVPHRVGSGEVGGDVIKTYEYRAAGLPVLTTPVAGAGERGLERVTVLEASRHHEYLTEHFRGWNRGRLPRIPEDIPEDQTWKFKAHRILDWVAG